MSGDSAALTVTSSLDGDDELLDVSSEDNGPDVKRAMPSDRVVVASVPASTHNAATAIEAKRCNEIQQQ